MTWIPEWFTPDAFLGDLVWTLSAHLDNRKASFRRLKSHNFAQLSRNLRARARNNETKLPPSSRETLGKAYLSDKQARDESEEVFVEYHETRHQPLDARRVRREDRERRVG